MSETIAFISHSSSDKGVALKLAAALRRHEVEVWIDHEQIALGDSIPARISEGLDRCDALLVLLSERFVASSWCRAEYEPLLMREIDSGKTLILPVRLDECAAPSLLSSKRYVDLRAGIEESVIAELAEVIRSGRTVKRIARLLPEQSNYECSMLGMILAGILKDFPVSALSKETLRKGKSLLQLYRAIEILIDGYEAACEEILQVLVESKIESRLYGSGHAVETSRLRSANRKLAVIATDMRESSGTLEGLLEGDSKLRATLTSVVELCASISVAEDFLVINLGAPERLLSAPMEAWGVETGEIQGLPISDNVQAPHYPGELGPQMVNDFHRIVEELGEYKRSLRREIARTA